MHFPEKYLKEKCWSKSNLQVFFKYFVDLRSTSKLFSKVSKFQTALGKISRHERVNAWPFHAEVTFIKGTKTFQTLPCWYSLDSPREVLSDEYPYARVSVISQLFSHCFVFTKLTTSSTKVKEFLPKLLCGTSILLTITFTMKMILQNIWRRVVGNVINNISLSNVFPILLLLIRLISSKLLGYFGSLWAIMD